MSECMGCEAVGQYGHEVLLDDYGYKLAYICVDSGYKYDTWRGVGPMVNLRCEYKCPECNEVYEL